MANDKADELRRQILDLTRDYYREQFAGQKPYETGDRISYGGRFFDEKELVSLVDSSLDFWLTSGKYCAQFESEFAKFLGVAFCSLTNSGSSANLLAFMALTSPALKERRILPGDEVITVACGFPTTVAPIMQYGAVPVFIDVTLPTYNLDVTMLEAALSPRTRAVMAAHTLGNPFDLRAVTAFCKKHNLWLIEDNCDALGSIYEMPEGEKLTGTIGDFGTSSFYPPHHMTMGEGGAVYTDNAQLHRLVESFRDWGRDCCCGSGKDDTCHHRFDGQYGLLPKGYDHKYVYSHLGYNLKATEMQASIGVAQLKKLPSFTGRRKENWQYLRDNLDFLSDVFVLPEATEYSKPSWFGFLLTVRENAGFEREEIVRALENNNIQTRMLFAGNLIYHPCFDTYRASGEGYRVVGELRNTDLIMNRTFWIGVYPGMDKARLDRMIQVITDFVKDRSVRQDKKNCQDQSTCR
jgi:CDP-6-deoxy-D-xylo-4-hexulose-3-dehydrase